MIVFDLDGTLIDTIGDLAAAVEHALAEGGFPGHKVDEYRKMVGHGIRNLVTRSLPEGVSETVVDETLKSFVVYYTKHIDVLSRPYPGIPELLRKLTDEGFKTAVASNKFQEGAEKLMQRFFPGIPFVRIIGNAPDLPLKPDPEVVRLAISAAMHQSTGAGSATVLRPYSAAAKRGRTRPWTGGGPAVQAIMVGDSATDIRTAHNAGIKAVAVTWGFRSREDLLDADAIADNPSDLYRIIKDYF